MKKPKQVGLTIGIIIVAVAAALLIRYRWCLPPDEINRARLDQLLKEKSIVSATVTPTLYPGIYTVEGAWNSASKPAKFTITTHLEEAQVKALLDGVDANVDVP